MKIAVIMDPIERIKPHKDTTFFLMLAAQERGHELFTVLHTSIRLRQGEVFGAMHAIKVFDRDRDFFEKEGGHIRSFSEMDAVLIRTDPPFDRRYSYACMMLDLIPPPTKVFNNPVSLLAWNEKLAAQKYPAFTPETLIANQVQEIKDFMRRVGGKIVAKPVDGHGGRGIFILEMGDKNIDQVLEMLTHAGSHWIVVQAYIHEASEGDKRILLVDGHPIGSILRVHAEGQELNNLDAGGSANPTELTSQDHEICEAMADDLRREGLFFVGIDIIGGRLIEVNVTSPTGLREAANFAKQPLHLQVIAAMEKHCQN